MPRGRRVNSNGEQSKQLLLEKAMKLFSTKGYYQTKISDIVKAANLTQPTFYLYFQSKESLYRDLNEQFQNQFFNIVHSDLEVYCKTELLECILTNLTNIFRFFADNPSLTKIGFFDSDESFYVKERFAEQLKQILEQRLPQSVLNGIDSKVFAESLIGAIERLTLTKLLTLERTPEQLASVIVDIYFAKQRELV